MAETNRAARRLLAPEADIITIGLMSGTSLDGVDAVAVRFPGEGAMKTLGASHVPMPSALRRELFSLAQGGGADEIERMGAAGQALAACYAEAVGLLLKKLRRSAREIAALGAHGQTIRHRPKAGFTLQLNDPARLAELTGIDVVADFRARDVAAGGEGAPLVPAFHASAFGCARARAVLNIGGIANATWIPAAADLQEKPVLGCDTGPGNMLLDSFVRRTSGAPYDKDGALAAQGQENAALLARCLSDPFFARPAPKSTGREEFSDRWLDEKLRGFEDLRAADVMATLCALTAESAAEMIARVEPKTESVLVCGGGALNPVLMTRLGAALERRIPGIALADTSCEGIDPMAVEGAAFAWLAKAFLCGEPGNLPAVTRAAGLRRLGAYYPAD